MANISRLGCLEDQGMVAWQYIHGTVPIRLDHDHKHLSNTVQRVYQFDSQQGLWIPTRSSSYSVSSSPKIIHDCGPKVHVRPFIRTLHNWFIQKKILMHENDTLTSPADDNKHTERWRRASQTYFDRQMIWINGLPKKFTDVCPHDQLMSFLDL
jgi:hypothetical protein